MEMLARQNESAVSVQIDPEEVWPGWYSIYKETLYCISSSQLDWCCESFTECIGLCVWVSIIVIDARVINHCFLRIVLMFPDSDGIRFSLGQIECPTAQHSAT